MHWSLISRIAAALLAVALARSAHSPPATGLIVLTRPDLLALLQAAILRAPCRDLAHTIALVTLAPPSPVPRGDLPPPLE